MPDGWVDAPTYGLTRWIHEFTWSGLLHSLKIPSASRSRRILASLGGAALVLLLIVVGLLVGTSPSPHGSATSPGTPSGQTAGTLPAATPTTVPPDVAGSPVDQSRPGWQITQNLGPLSLGLTGVACATGTTCEAVGVTGYGTALALGTTNGGTAWSQQALPKVNGSLTAVACPSRLDCIAVGSGAYLTTTNSGVNWTQHSFGRVSLTGISCAGSKFCLAVGSSATQNSSCPSSSSYASTDGEKTWSKATLGCVAPTNVFCSSATTCEVIGQAVSNGAQYGLIMGTSDGGSNWQVQYKLVGGATSLNGITCTSSENCLVVGGSLKVPILTTIDGGATWTAPPAPFTAGALVAVACDAVPDLSGRGKWPVPVDSRRRRDLGNPSSSGRHQGDHQRGLPDHDIVRGRRGYARRYRRHPAADVVAARPLARRRPRCHEGTTNITTSATNPIRVATCPR